jgi:hypothetical protein
VQTLAEQNQFFSESSVAIRYVACHHKQTSSVWLHYGSGIGTHIETWYITDITKDNSACKTELKFDNSLAKASQKQTKLNYTAQVLIPLFST